MLLEHITSRGMVIPPASWASKRPFFTPSSGSPSTRGSERDRPPGFRAFSSENFILGSLRQKDIWSPIPDFPTMGNPIPEFRILGNPEFGNSCIDFAHSGHSGFLKSGSESRQGSGAHMIKNMTPNSRGVLSTMASPNPESVWSGTDAAVRELQKHGFCQNQDLVPSFL